MYWIGIDPGTHTGFAVWDSKRKRLVELDTMLIHKALQAVLDYARESEVFVVFEDARQRTWFGNNKNTSAKLQGAGSIKRDSSIWDDFLTDNDIPFRAIPPMKGGTKLSEEYFKLITGWKGRTSNHARDAAMLVFGK